MKQKDILSIIIPLSIFSIVWVGFSIHHNAVTSTISEVLNIAISPINPTFDTGIIDKLSKRNKITPVYTNANSNTSSQSAQAAIPSINPKPSAPINLFSTPSAVPTLSQKEASSGAVTGGT